VDAVLVLNADLGPLHRVSLRHAIRMLLRQVAEIHEAEPDRLIGVYPLPRVVRLVRYVVTRWRYSAGPAWSRQGVLNRDGRRCGYCHAPATTVDHVLPRSRGGRNSWKNTVAACDPCNQHKRDRTPAEAGDAAAVHPVRPHLGVADAALNGRRCGAARRRPSMRAGVTAAPPPLERTVEVRILRSQRTTIPTPHNLVAQR
jgi:5-methylcytosine-specific restriction endonuclease McrA